MTRKELIEKIRSEGDLNDSIAVNIWTIEDVKRIAGVLDHKLSKDERNEILAGIMDCQKDDKDTICWSTIAWGICRYMQEKRKRNGEE